MKKFLVLFFISTFYISSVLGSVQAYFSYTTFNTPTSGPYIETHLSIMGNTALFVKNEIGKFQASLEVTMIFKQNDSIVEFRKFNLLSPEIDDTIQSKPNFIDLHRIPLPNGRYNFELTISDNINDSFTHNGTIDINYDNSNISFSDIEMIESYSETSEPNILTKCGFDMIPYFSDFYPQNINKLIFYAELYNSDKVLKDDEFLIRYYLEDYNSKTILKEYNRFQKKKSASVNVIFGEFSIKKLYSGNYNLVIEARNKKNELLQNQKFFFFRSNPKPEVIADKIPSNNNLIGTFVQNYASIDSLAEHIDYLYPISDVRELTYAQNQIKSRNLESMQQFFYSFWGKRSSLEPKKEWEKYYKKVLAVNKEYRCRGKKGYQTDRGRVYLQYGLPNDITKNEFNDSGYPYEIWHYYKCLDGQTNKTFTFYNPTVAGNNLILLHSNAKGEISNPNWQRY